MLTFDSIHAYPSNMKWENRIKRITKSLINLKIQKRILIIGLNDTNVSKCFKYNKATLVFLIKQKDFYLGKFINKILNFLYLYYVSYKRLSRIQYDYFNPHCLSMLPLAVFLKAFNKKIKIIYDTHELETEVSGMSKIRKLISKIVEIFCIRYVDETVVVSPMIAKWYRDRYLLKNIHIVRNLPDLKEVKMKNVKNIISKFQINKNKLLFCYQGILSDERQSLKLATFFSKKPTIGQILFIGFGPDEIFIKQFAEKYKNIFYCPPLKLNDLYSTLKIADICFSLFKTMNLNQKFALPNKIFESFSAGKPVIVNIGGESQNLIEKLNAGWAINSIDKDLEKLILDLTKNNIKLKSKNALNASKNLNWSKEEKKLFLIYKNR